MRLRFWEIWPLNQLKCWFIISSMFMLIILLIFFMKNPLMKIQWSENRLKFWLGMLLKYSLNKMMIENKCIQITRKYLVLYILWKMTQMQMSDLSQIIFSKISLKILPNVLRKYLVLWWKYLWIYIREKENTIRKLPTMDIKNLYRNMETIISIIFWITWFKLKIKEK